MLELGRVLVMNDTVFGRLFCPKLSKLKDGHVGVFVRDRYVVMVQVRSPLSVIFFSPEGVVRLVHEHAVLEEHDIHEPPEEEEHGKHEEELPVGPGEGRDEGCDDEEVEERTLRPSVPHSAQMILNYLIL